MQRYNNIKQMGNFPKNNSFLTYRLKKTPQGYFSLRGLDVSKERNHHATKGCKVKIAFDKTLNNNALERASLQAVRV